RGTRDSERRPGSLSILPRPRHGLVLLEGGASQQRDEQRQRPRVLVVGADCVRLHALASLDDLELVGAAATLAEAQAMVESLRPDVVVLEPLAVAAGSPIPASCSVVVLPGRVRRRRRGELAAPVRRLPTGIVGALLACCLGAAQELPLASAVEDGPPLHERV